MRAQTVQRTTEDRPLACPPWCIVPAEDHERDWTHGPGAIHWSEPIENDGLKVALCTDVEGRAEGDPDIYLSGSVEPITPAQATALAHRLLATVAMCSGEGVVR